MLFDSWHIIHHGARTGILKQSMGARNRVGHRLAESIPGLLKSLKITSLDVHIDKVHAALSCFVFTERNVLTAMLHL